MVPALLSWTSCPAWILILPPAPLPEAVLNSPLPGPEIEAELTVTVTSPPWPAPDVLLSTLAPPACAKLPTFSDILPALPLPEVFTDNVPPSEIVSVGVDTVICPAFPEPAKSCPASTSIPALSEVRLLPFWTSIRLALREILPALPLPNVVVDTVLPAPEIEMLSAAVKVTSPARPVPIVITPSKRSCPPLMLRIDAPPLL